MDKEFIYQERTLHYRDEGKGPCVLLIHGFPEDGSVWNAQVAALSDSFRLLVPDLPGSGKSAPLREDRNLSIEELADVLSALIEYESAGPVVAAGHSMGGYIALAMTERDPGLIRSVALVHSTAKADSVEKKEGRKKSIEVIERHGSYPFLRNMVPGMFGTAFRQAHREKVAELIELGSHIPPLALQQFYTAMMNRPDRTEVLSGNGKPFLFVIGSEDQAIPPAEVMPLTTLPKASYIHVLDGIGHMSLWEAPDQLNIHLRSFASLA